MATKFLIRKDFKQYMKFRGWTVKSLAAMIGYKEPQVCSIINRKIEPSMRFLHDLCEATSLRLEELIETAAVK